MTRAKGQRHYEYRLEQEGAAKDEQIAFEKARVRACQTFLWRIREAVMQEGGWCYDYKTADGKRIADAVNAIWREARDG